VADPGDVRVVDVPGPGPVSPPAPADALLNAFAQLSPAERTKLVAQAQAMAVPAKPKAPSRNCSKCRAFLGGRVGVDLVCDRCRERVNRCCLCGDKSSEEVCPDCIEAGARVCDGCLRPAMVNNDLCSVCDAAFRRQNAGNFREEVAPVTPGAELR
jgi:hypothetical protein